MHDAGTPYDILGVASDAPPDAVKRAAFSAFRLTHPDKGGSQDQFYLAQLAWRVLRYPESRELYNASGEFLDDGPGAHEQQAP